MFCCRLHSRLSASARHPGCTSVLRYAPNRIAPSAPSQALRPTLPSPPPRSYSSLTSCMAANPTTATPTMAAVGQDLPLAPDVYHMGPGTLRISRKALHGKLRSRVLEALRAALPEGRRGLVWLEGGKQGHLYNSDTETLFKQEAYMHYLFGVQEADWCGALCVNTGRTLLFMPRLPPSYAVWMGPLMTPEEAKEKYGVDAVHYMDEAAEVLKSLGPSCLHVLKGDNTDSGLPVGPPPVPEPTIPLETDTLFDVMTECRVIKTPEEVSIIRYANQVGAAAHIAAMRSAATHGPGVMEYQLESVFLATSYERGGCRSAMYTPIVASGSNGAVLHYGHAGAPNDRQTRPGDLVLMDCGCEYYLYGSDITTTWPVDGKFSPQQRVVYETVLAAQKAVLGAMKPGVLWPAMQDLAYRALLAGLVRGGLLVGEVDDMMEADVAALFMPHGLGHFLGLNTHDVGGYPPRGPPRPTRPGYRSLRTARPLAPGMVITVEPGCYFNPALLLPALEDPATSRFLARDVILSYLNMGGVRLEDNVVVTENGAESLTHVPRSLEQVEAVMAGAEW